MLHTHAAWAHQVERVEIDLLISAHLAWARLDGLGGHRAARAGPAAAVAAVAVAVAVMGANEGRKAINCAA